jgi:hypothetical protein
MLNANRNVVKKCRNMWIICMFYIRHVYVRGNAVGQLVEALRSPMLLALGSTQPLTECRSISWEVKLAGEQEWQPCHVTCRLSVNLVASASWNPYGLNRDSVIRVAARFELDCPVIEFRLELDFPHISRTALGSTSAMYIGCPFSFLGKFMGYSRENLLSLLPFKFSGMCSNNLKLNLELCLFCETTYEENCRT